MTLEGDWFTTGMRSLIRFRLAYDDVLLSSDANKRRTISRSMFAFGSIGVRFYNTIQSNYQEQCAVRYRRH